MPSWDYGDNLHITTTQLEDGTSSPKIWAARVFPSREAFYGYGTTEGEAIVDLLRARRDQGT